MKQLQPIQKKAFLSHVLFNNIRAEVDDLFSTQPNPSLVIDSCRRIITGFDKIASTHDIMANWLSHDTGLTLTPDEITVELSLHGATYSTEPSPHVNLAICLYDNSANQWPFYIAPVAAPNEWVMFLPRPNQVVMWDQTTHLARRDAFTGKCHLTLNLRFNHN